MKTEKKYKGGIPETVHFDAVEFMRERRDQINKETEGMTAEEEIKFVQEKFVEYERKKRN